MKKYFGLFSLLLLALVFMTSCAKEKEEEDSLMTENSVINTVNSLTGDSVVVNYPVAIDDYVNQHYPNEIIDEVELDEDGNYEVELSDGTELLFDSDGIFIEIILDDDDEDDGDDDEDDDEEDDEDEDEDEDDNTTIDYPAAIDEYVALNHPGTIIVEVELEDDGNYEVELDDGTELVFDADGNLII